MNTRPNDSSPPRLGRLRWIIGTPYAVQGTSTFTEVPILYFIKNVLQMGDAGGQLFDALRQTGWFVKPLWGLISDKLPLGGYHRKSWYVLMALLATVFWTLNAILALAGVTVPLVYLLTFNLAFATYAFVDVVCDALMVTRGRELDRVGSLIHFQWAVLGLANAVAVYLGGWFQEEIQSGRIAPWAVFALTALPPLVTTAVGLRNIDETPLPRSRRPDRRRPRRALAAGMAGLARRLPGLRDRFRDLRRQNRLTWLLILFIFFWKFSPSVGYIERSYLIDERAFTPSAFGLILAVGGITFFVSVLAYSWMTRRLPAITWYHYLYAMVMLGALAFPLSFYLYLDPSHPWWRLFDISLPAGLNPLPGWNRYQWFRLVVQTTLGFASIPAFLIPLTIAGETVNLAYAGVGYAFLMSLSNVTNMFEGVVGAALYDLFTSPALAGVVAAFGRSPLNIAATLDERTLILELFVYISLLFTLLTIPFIELLRRELDRRGIAVRLGRPS